MKLLMGLQTVLSRLRNSIQARTLGRFRASRARLLSVALATMALTLLSACENGQITMPSMPQQLKPGTSTIAEVLTTMGKPSREEKNDDGSTTYEFTRQPMGTECFVAVVSEQQILQSLEQIITDENMAKVVSGMDRTTLRKLLGKPASVTTMPTSREEVWDWHIKSTFPHEDAHFYAHINPESGLVIRSSRGVVQKG